MSIIGSKTVLCLQIKEQCLNEIISGKKTSEYRKVNRFYISRLCEVNKKGEIENIKHFDLLKVYLGNVKEGRYAICKIKGIYLNQYENEIPEGLKKGDMLFEIEIGKILEHK